MTTLNQRPPNNTKRVYRANDLPPATEDQQVRLAHYYASRKAPIGGIDVEVVEQW